MPFGLGIWEIVILAASSCSSSAAKGAPAMARRLGTGVKEMKDAVTEMHPRSLLDPKDEPAKPAAARAAPDRGGSATASAPLPKPPPRSDAEPPAS